jgi:apolipoprotein N-acyltransferase
VSASGWKLPALAGLLVGVSYFPGPFLPLNLAGFVPLLAWVDGRASATPYERLKAGFLFGLLTHLTANHFMYSMLEHSWLAVLLWIGMSGLLAVRISLSVALLGWLRRRTGLSFGLLLPVVWLPFEWAQTWGDLRMTGEHLSHTVAGYPFLVQFADVLGPYGVGALLLAVNGLLYEAVARRGRPAGRRAWVGLTVVAAAVLGYDAWAWNRALPESRALRVGLIQPNVPLSVKHDAATVQGQWNDLAELTREAAARGAELIVWPESARPWPVYHFPDRGQGYAMPEVQALAREIGVPLVVGTEYVVAPDGGAPRVYNAAMGVDAGGRLLPEWGAKVYLVPFVEATPFRSLLGPLVRGRGGEWQWLAGVFEPGPRSAVLDLAGARVGVLVCYEELFPDLASGLRAAGAELQLVITNDAWFGRSLFQPYQANALRLRAIENRTDYVRVANTGISGFVDRRGRYHQMTALFEKSVQVREVALTSRPTLYNRLGNVVAWVAIAALLALVAALLVGRGHSPFSTG